MTIQGKKLFIPDFIVNLDKYTSQHEGVSHYLKKRMCQSYDFILFEIKDILKSTV